MAPTSRDLARDWEKGKVRWRAYHEDEHVLARLLRLRAEFGSNGIGLVAPACFGWHYSARPWHKAVPLNLLNWERAVREARGITRPSRRRQVREQLATREVWGLRYTQLVVHGDTDAIAELEMDAEVTVGTARCGVRNSGVGSIVKPHGVCNDVEKALLWAIWRKAP